MAIIQKLFTLSFFVFITLFTQVIVSASTFIQFEGINQEVYILERVNAPPADGKHLIATHKRSGNQVIMIAHNGKIQSVFVQSASGKINTLEATIADCSQGGFCSTFQMKKCFILPSGDCFCICGNWFTDNTIRGASNDDCIMNPKNCLSGFKARHCP